MLASGDNWCTRSRARAGDDLPAAVETHSVLLDLLCECDVRLCELCYRRGCLILLTRVHFCFLASNSNRTVGRCWRVLLWRLLLVPSRQ